MIDVTVFKKKLLNSPCFMLPSSYAKPLRAENGISNKREKLYQNCIKLRMA